MIKILKEDGRCYGENIALKVDREYSGELKLNWASQGRTLNIDLKNKRESHVETWGIVLQRHSKYPET